MRVLTRTIELQTEGNAAAIDITSRIREALVSTQLEAGIVTVFVPGATGAVTTVEYEPGLLRDLEELWERIAPRERVYAHDRAWGDGNGHSHLRASLLGPSLTLPFTEGRLLLGTWQQVIFVDFDVRPRSRRIILQFLGERSTRQGGEGASIRS